MNRFPSSGRNTGVGSALLAAAGLAALAVAALGSSTRRSAMVRDRSGNHQGDRNRFGGRDGDDRHRRGMGGSNQDRDAGLDYETRRQFGWDRDEADDYGGQNPSHRMMGSAYGGYGQGGPEGDRDYRGRGYGSDYLQGGYDPDNDYREGMSGSGGGGRGMGSTPGEFGRGADYDRRSDGNSQRFGDAGSGSAGDERGGSGTSGRSDYAGNLMAAHRGRGPKGYTRSDDRIREDVCDRLTDDPHIDASEIDVRVAQGEVTLSGTVIDRTAKRYAEDLAERIGGVRHVQNNLRVSPAGTLAGMSGASAMTSSTIDTADVAGAIGITGAPDQTIASGT
jgi:osmotically-inducible protein OsmY